MIWVVGRVVLQRTILTETGDRAVDEVGLACLQGLVIEAEPRHHTGPKILHQRVGTVDEAKKHPRPRGFEIEGERALAGVLPERHAPIWRLFKSASAPSRRADRHAPGTST